MNFTRAQIQTHSYCNAMCIMCPYRYTSKTLSQGKMGWELFCKVIDDLVGFPSLKLISLMLQNEPLLNENILEEIKYVKMARPDIEISISTNGFYLTSKLTKQLVDAGLDSLIFSINALTKNTFESVEKGLDYDNVFENLRSLIGNKPKKLCVIVKGMVIQDNAIEFGISEKFSDIPKLLSAKNIPFDISPISNRAGALKNYDDLLIFDHFQSSKQKTICNDLFDTVSILYNGDMIGCCADWNRESILGNLRNQNIGEIMSGPEVTTRMEMIREGKYDQILPCKNCSQAKNILSNLWKKTNS